MTKEAYIRQLERQLKEYKRREKARKERNKIITTIIALTLALTTPIVVVYAQDRSKMQEWTRTREVKTICVQAGDSIDGYWAEYAPYWMGRHDYREAIQELNDMESAFLYEGQLLKIYTEGGN
jgi:hypothetical protein